MAHMHIIVNKNFKENLKLLCFKGYYQKDKLKKIKKSTANYILAFNIQIYRILVTQQNDRPSKTWVKDLNRNFPERVHKCPTGM